MYILCDKREFIMKIAVVIDYNKIKKLKTKLKKKDYLDTAINELAYELSLVFK